MTPDLYLRRGLQYTFKIEGGNNAASAEFYHPFIITDEPVGGYNRLTKEQKSKVIEKALAAILEPFCFSVDLTLGRFGSWRGWSSLGEVLRDQPTTVAGSAGDYHNHFEVGCPLDWVVVTGGTRLVFS